VADSDTIEIPLGEMIETLRQELQVAQARGAGQAVAFDIDKVELELQIVVSRKKTGDGKIAFWVLSLGGGLERAGEATHKFNLTLSPVSSRSGKRLQVSGEAEQPLTED
jgi:hypothetical protein